MTEHKVGIIGWPVEHSLSPAMHNAAFVALGMTDWVYERYAIPPDIVGLSIREFRDHGVVGLNVTVPHKAAALQYVRPDALSQRIGAVNTINLRDLRATNTDVAGFMDDLKAHDVEVAGQRVVVLGAGGAARAAVYGLAEAGAVVAVVNRSPERASQLIADLLVDAMPMTLEQALRVSPALVVNCTSVGMWPHIDESPWPANVPFPAGAVAYDMVYRPETTRFLQQATAAGARAVGGLGMLVRQGAAAFSIWTGVEPPVDVMMQAARRALEENVK